MSAASGTAGRFARDLPPPTDAPPTSPREMLAIASKHRIKIAAALLAPPLLALALMVVLPRTYRAQTDIVVKTGSEYMAQGNSESAALTAPSSTKQESINSEVALLTSRAVIVTTIGAIGVAELYPDIVANPPSSGTVMDAAVLSFIHDLTVEPVKLSNVISLSFDAVSPAQASRVLDALVRAYVDKHTQVFASRRTGGFRDSIDRAMAEVRLLEQRRSVLKLADGVFDFATQRNDLIHQRLDAESRLEDVRSRRAKLMARLAFLGKSRSEVPAATLAAATEQSDARTHAAEALIDLHQQASALASRVGDANPDLQRLRSQITTVERVATGTRKERNTTTAPSPLRQQIEQEAMTAGAELATTGTEIDHLQTFVAARDAELRRLERADLDLRDLGLQIDITTQNLRAMQGRFEQARADEQTDLARQVSVVQVAQAGGSEKPVGPRKLVYGAAGLMGGVLLAGIVALLAILTSKTAVTGDAAERRIGLPVLAVVPFDGDADEPAFGTS